MSSIKTRFGNVVAWAAFGLFIYAVLSPVTILMGIRWETEIQTQPTYEPATCEDYRATESGARYGCEGFAYFAKGTYGNTTVVGTSKYSYDEAEYYTRVLLADKTSYSRFFNRIKNYWDDDVFLPLAGLWVLILTLNYILYGSIRFLPWKAIPTKD